MFNNEPNPTPKFCATFSVAKVNNSVSGIIAIAFNAKIMVLFFMPAMCETMPNGTKMSKSVSHDRENMCLMENKTPSEQLLMQDGSGDGTLTSRLWPWTSQYSFC